MVWSRGLVSLLCMCFPVPEHNLLKKLSFPHWLILAPWHTLVDCIWAGLILGFLFRSIGLQVLFCVPVPYCFYYFCGMIWNQEMWYFWLCSFSPLLWLFGMFNGSMYILGLFFLFLWMEFYFCNWNFDRTALNL